MNHVETTHCFRSRPLAASFEAVAGSVTGRDHHRAHRDGQDGFALVATPDVTAAVVTDGCSSGRASEVGARLGAAWIAQLVRDVFSVPDAHLDPIHGAKAVTSELVDQLDATARTLSGEDAIDPSVVADMFLFGFLAAVVTDKSAIVFGVGDGIVWVDGSATTIDPGPENAPIYPAYALVGATIEPRILHHGRANEIETLAVATDGAAELLGSTAEPSFESLVRDDRLFRNPSLLRKRLIALSDRGCFWDDATIGVLRRRSSP